MRRLRQLDQSAVTVRAVKAVRDGRVADRVDRVVHADKKKKAPVTAKRYDLVQGPSGHAKRLELAARLVKSGKYNELYAVGHQLGPVPKPLFSPGKASFSYLPTKGTVKSTFIVAAGQNAVVILCPQYVKPVVVLNMLGSGDMIWPGGTPFALGPAVTGDNSSWPQPNTLGVPWIGTTDPRTLVNSQPGQEGPPDDTYEDAGSQVLLQQFMGGRIHFKATSSYNGAAIVSVVDSKSLPTMYGSKLPPTNTHGQLDGSGVVCPSAPDAEDCMRWFVVEDSVAQLTVAQWTQAAENLPFVGAGDTSSAHLSMNIGPEGQMWMPWSNNYSAGVGASSVGNAAIGGIPARQPAALLALGYGFIVINNSNSSGSVSCSLAGEFSYNVAIPTRGTGAIPALAQRAPVTEAHTAMVTQLHSVAVLHHDEKAATVHHAQASATASIDAGVSLPKRAFIPPLPVAPATAKVAVGAGENLHPASGGPLGDVVHTVADVAGKVLSPVADVVGDIGSFFGL